MAVQVIVLGAGTGRLIVAHQLARKARRDGIDMHVRLVGNTPMHTCQRGLLFLPFQTPGYRAPSEIQKPTADFVAPGVEYVEARIFDGPRPAR